MKRSLQLYIMLSMLTAGTLWAQQRPQYSLYMVNNYVLNPAITGIEDYADLKLGYRNQWQGIEGAPITSYMSIQTPVGNANKLSNPEWQKKRRPTFSQYRTRHKSYNKTRAHHGVGAVVMADQIGPFQQFEAHMTYAYHIMLNSKIKLSQGVSAGFSHYSVNRNKMSLADGLDNAIYHEDLRQTKPDVFAGLWLYSDDFYVGASATQLLGNVVGASDAIFRSKVLLKPHYFLTAGYAIAPNDQLVVIPSVMFKFIRPAPISVDLNVRLVYRSRAWAGVSYRNQESVAIIAGVAVNPLLDLGYAFDTSTSGIASYGNGSHEVLLGFKLRNRYKVYCPQNMW